MRTDKYSHNIIWLLVWDTDNVYGTFECWMVQKIKRINFIYFCTTHISTKTGYVLSSAFFKYGSNVRILLIQIPVIFVVSVRYISSVKVNVRKNRDNDDGHKHKFMVKIFSFRFSLAINAWPYKKDFGVWNVKQELVYVVII